MITPVNIIIYFRIFDIFPTFTIYHEIIQSPTDVFDPSSCSHTPPRILDCLGIEFPIRVDPTLFKKLSKTFSLFNSETCSFLVSFRSCYVNLLMTYV